MLWGFEVTEYEKKLTEFKKEVCPVGTAESFDRLFRLYRGDGQFVPLLDDGALDRKTIELTLPLYEEKAVWIKEQISQINKLRKKSPLEKFDAISRGIRAEAFLSSFIVRSL